MRKSSIKEPILLDLVVFINEETRLLNDPLFSRDAVSQYQEKRRRRSMTERKRGVATFLAKTEIQANESFTFKLAKSPKRVY